ncbi:MAG: hypothetical protein KY410_08850 [Proteobacteria bacterium]|nr:hypothetical protein [Pseudomonadota bacterium]
MQQLRAGRFHRGIAGAASVAELRAAIENAGYTVSDPKQDFNESNSCCGLCQI